MPARFDGARFLRSVAPALDLAFGVEIEGALPETFDALVEALRAGRLGEGPRPDVAAPVLETA